MFFLSLYLRMRAARHVEKLEKQEKPDASLKRARFVQFFQFFQAAPGAHACWPSRGGEGCSSVHRAGGRGSSLGLRSAGNSHRIVGLFAGSPMGVVW